ncbi:MAG: acyl-CoA thioesterase [Cellvibrionales bacterium]|nr:acyl-CoA thioesterase [Cellvibrionales bacterium]|tara:strand:+ start:25659 stop:26048 length:390 start_codon:yes stop_codon:yes gene_type:complete
MDSIDDNPSPNGEMSLQTIAMPKDTNASGDIFGGWLLSQMDIAAAVAAGKVAGGRVATVAIDNMNFLVPVHVGAIVGCYTEVVNVGRSSIQVIVEVWIDKGISGEKIKVTEGLFVFVAIDNNGRTRAVS